MHFQGLSEVAVAQDALDKVSALCDLAAAGLPQMLVPEKQLFCNTFIREGGKMICENLSPRYTMMTLLGLAKYEKSGRRSTISIPTILDRLVSDLSWLNSTGDLGLLLWTCAEIEPERLPRVYQAVDAADALTRYLDGRQGCTMEVAWYLTGLVACCSAGYADLPGIKAPIKIAREILEGNRGQSGVYGHRAHSGPLATYLRRRIGTFADQVYPTIALARLAMEFSDESASRMAFHTASKMCALQGDMGEWSWHYDAATGKVISRYPVYSVHQHAMAPMMLLDAGKAANFDFRAAIHKGVEWITGNNELGQSFIDSDLNLVWRCVHLTSVQAYLDALQRYFGLRKGISPASLSIRFECRPYELGWLLYAFADK